MTLLNKSNICGKQFCIKVADKNNFKHFSNIDAASSTSKRGRDTARDALGSSVFETVSSFIQGLVKFIAFVVKSREAELWEDGLWGNEMLFCLQLKGYRLFAMSNLPLF